MNIVLKKTVVLLCILAIVTGIWLLSRTVKIIAVHQYSSTSDVIVQNFPLTDKGKINWWLKNADMLKKKYHIPNPAPYGAFSITFWDFDDGYKEEGKYDRLCFNDMQTKKNCIDKNAVFAVHNTSEGEIVFLTYDGVYKQKGGEITPLRD
ncbi:DUF943 family protein [Brenneria corticis]|uniref:DUF943 domain-containing protein n=1 Tax=Brenneria corticis TaxID=2173106 RepID=A0A2U1TU75_9GAMM|nr:DUF943 family protein [Brenneria sp. CFCC 11842]PWC12939.1 hypothetical protein DDT56_16030 [Brenneria sp. CFCC 11842]